MVAKIRTERVSARTPMDVRGCALAFKQATDAVFSGRRAKLAAGVHRLAGYSGEVEYFTPVDDSPFSQFEQGPDFVVGARIPNQMAGGKGNVWEVHMYVRDIGEFRDLEIAVTHQLVSVKGARKFVARFVDALQSADPALEISE